MEVNGVFEGGGVRAIALAGAAAAAIEAGVTFGKVAGTSAGGLVASLVAAGYDAEELADSVCSVDWPGLLDPVPMQRLPLIGSHLALIVHKGLYRGRRLERVWGGLLSDKGIRTFGDLGEGRLRVVVTDLSHMTGLIVPNDLVHYGIDPESFPVARALRMSAAVPFLFRPVALGAPATGERVLFADGAMASNYPIEAATADRPILGFRLFEDAAEHPHVAIRGPASLARSVVIAGIRARYGLPSAPAEGEAILRIPVSADLDFNLSPGEAEQMFLRGKRAAAEQLADLGFVQIPTVSREDPEPAG